MQLRVRANESTTAKIGSMAGGAASGNYLRGNGTNFVSSQLVAADVAAVVGAVPNLTLGTSNASGSANTFVRTDATILAFDATSPAALGTAATQCANLLKEERAKKS